MEEPFVPTWFRGQLSAESDNRLRLRFSHKRGLWQIEAKRHRAKNMDRPLSPFDDEAIRERDGYDLVLEVAPGRKIVCPNEFKVEGKVVRCGHKMVVPVHQWKEATCGRCRGRLTAPYFPLGEDLLAHLRYIDPDRDGILRVFADVDKAEANRLETLRRTRHNVAEAIFSEERRRVLEIPMVGYTPIRKVR